MSNYLKVTILNPKGHIRSRLIDVERIILVEETDDQVALICLSEEINIKCLESFVEVMKGIKSASKIYDCEKLSECNITLLPVKTSIE